MGTTANIKKGLCIKFNNDIYKVIDFLHVKPGKGSAFIRTKLKSLTSGKIIDNTFSAGHKINEVEVKTREYQYLYMDGDNMYFMNNEDFTQIFINKKNIPNYVFIKPSEIVKIIFNIKNDEALSVEIPNSILCEILYTEPGIKGDSATNTMKVATLDIGIDIKVPLFINTGDIIKVSTENGTYIERIK